MRRGCASLDSATCGSVNLPGGGSSPAKACSLGNGWTVQSKRLARPGCRWCSARRPRRRRSGYARNIPTYCRSIFTPASRGASGRGDIMIFRAKSIWRRPSGLLRRWPRVTGAIRMWRDGRPITSYVATIRRPVHRPPRATSSVPGVSGVTAALTRSTPHGAMCSGRWSMTISTRSSFLSLPFAKQIRRIGWPIAGFLPIRSFAFMTS